jgi:hypothetical protein
MNKETFITNYLPQPQQGMARHLLPDAVQTLEDWRSHWSRLLNSPAH